MFPQHLVLVLWHHSSPLSIYSLVFHTSLRFPWRKRVSLSSVPSNIPGTWQMLRKENSFSLQPKTSLPKVKVPSPPAHTGTKHFWDYKRLPELSWDTERTVIEEDTIIFSNKSDHFILLLQLPISLTVEANVLPRPQLDCHQLWFLPFPCSLKPCSFLSKSSMHLPQALYLLLPLPGMLSPQASGWVDPYSLQILAQMSLISEAFPGHPSSHTVTSSLLAPYLTRFSSTPSDHSIYLFTCLLVCYLTLLSRMPAPWEQELCCV